MKGATIERNVVAFGRTEDMTLPLQVKRWLIVLLSALAVATFSSGCHAPTADYTDIPNYSLEQKGTAENFRLRVGDLVIIPLRDKTYEERVKEDGAIDLPRTSDSLIVAGKTAQELQNELAKRYPEISPQHQEDGLYYHVSGEVNVCGSKSYVSSTTVTKAISAAGGLTKFANIKNIKLTRREGLPVIVNYERALANPALDPAVLPGDSIWVSRSIWR